MKIEWLVITYIFRTYSVGRVNNTIIKYNLKLVEGGQYLVAEEANKTI